MSVPPEQFMSSEQLTVAAVFWGSAVVIGLDAIKHNGPRAKALWSTSVAFVLAGFLVKPLWNTFPDVSRFLLGIAAWPPTWFILAVGAYLTIRSKLPSQDVAPQNGAVAVPYSSELQDSIANLRMEYDGANVSNRLDALEGGHKAVITDYQNVLAQLTKLNDRLGGTTDAFMDRMNKQDAIIGGVSNQVVVAASQGVRANDDIRRSLIAVYDRERLIELAAQIETCAEALYQRIRDENQHDDESWKDWLKTHGVWNANLEMWLEVAKPYMRQVEFIVSVVNEPEYEGDWTIKDHQVPTADDVRKFKRHRIIHRHWTDAIPHVMHAVRRIAFEGAPPPIGIEK